MSPAPSTPTCDCLERGRPSQGSSLRVTRSCPQRVVMGWTEVVTREGLRGAVAVGIAEIARQVYPVRSATSPVASSATVGSRGPRSLTSSGRYMVVRPWRVGYVRAACPPDSRAAVFVRNRPA